MSIVNPIYFITEQEHTLKGKAIEKDKENESFKNFIADKQIEFSRKCYTYHATSLALDQDSKAQN